MAYSTISKQLLTSIHYEKGSYDFIRDAFSSGNIEETTSKLIYHGYITMAPLSVDEMYVFQHPAERTARHMRVHRNSELGGVHFQYLTSINDVIEEWVKPGFEDDLFRLIEEEGLEIVGFQHHHGRFVLLQEVSSFAECHTLELYHKLIHKQWEHLVMMSDPFEDSILDALDEIDGLSNES